MLPWRPCVGRPTSVNAGFSFGDVYEAGPSVIVIGDGPSEAYQQAVEHLMDMAEQSRDVSTVRLISIEDAVAKARAPASAPGPLILADYTDGPGGGGYGDATKLLAALLEAQIPGTVVGALYDPDSAQEAIQAGVGRACSLRIGGKTDPRFGGPPVPITGIVCAVSDGSYVRKGPFETGTRASLGPSSHSRASTHSVPTLNRMRERSSMSRPAASTIAQCVDAHTRHNPASQALFDKALAAMPGGNTRSGLFYEPFPLAIRRGEGCRLWDAGGHEYADFLAESTAGIHGHSNPVIRSVATLADQRSVLRDAGRGRLREPETCGSAGRPRVPS